MLKFSTKKQIKTKSSANNHRNTYNLYPSSLQTLLKLSLLKMKIQYKPEAQVEISRE